MAAIEYKGVDDFHKWFYNKCDEYAEMGHDYGDLSHFDVAMEAWDAATERAVKKFTSTNKPSAQLPADIKEKFDRWVSEQQSVPPEIARAINEHFWDLI